MDLALVRFPKMGGVFLSCVGLSFSGFAFWSRAHAYCPVPERVTSGGWVRCMCVKHDQARFDPAKVLPPGLGMRPPRARLAVDRQFVSREALQVRPAGTLGGPDPREPMAG